MKQLCFYILMLLLSATSAMAQKADNTHVSVRCGDTPLEILLTDGQKQAVTHLTVTGVLLDEDYKYLRETLFGQLKELNMRDADIDTIPEGAFECNSLIERVIILPYTLKYVSNNAFCNKGEFCTYYITGQFPSLGDDVFTKSLLCDNNFQISDDNIFLQKSNDYIISKDGLKLLYYLGEVFDKCEIPYGISVIGSKSFEHKKLLSNHFSIPETVDSIGDEAFYDAYQPRIDGINSDEPLFICKATTPPKLGRNVFGTEPERQSIYGIGCIYVPDESLSLYNAAEGWKDLFVKPIRATGINGVAYNDNISIINGKTDLLIKTDTYADAILVYNICGQLVKTYKSCGHECVLNKASLGTDLAMIVIIFKNGSIYTKKIQL